MWNIRGRASDGNQVKIKLKYTKYNIDKHMRVHIDTQTRPITRTNEHARKQAPHTRAHARTHTHVCSHARPHAHAPVRARTRAHVHTCTRAHAHTRKRAHAHTRTRAHAHVRTYARTHVRTYASTHVRTYAREGHFLLGGGHFEAHSPSRGALLGDIRCLGDNFWGHSLSGGQF